jgi:hypothetical protein
MSETIEVTGRLSVYLRGGAVIDLSRGHARVVVGAGGRPESLEIGDNQVELVWIDTAEVVAIVKEGEARETRMPR